MRRLFVVLALLVAPSAYSQSINREALRGLPSVPVHVKFNGLADGVFTSELQSMAELRLRRAGISVPSDNSPVARDGRAVLFLDVLVTDEQVLAQLQLKQLVTLKRRSRTETYSITWSLFDIQACGKFTFASGKSSAVKLLDYFINDYLAVNPKQ